MKNSKHSPTFRQKRNHYSAESAEAIHKTPVEGKRVVSFRHHSRARKEEEANCQTFIHKASMAAAQNSDLRNGRWSSQRQEGNGDVVVA